MAGTSRKEEVPLMTKKEKLKYGCFVTMVMLLWVSLGTFHKWRLNFIAKIWPLPPPSHQIFGPRGHSREWVDGRGKGGVRRKSTRGHVTEGRKYIKCPFLSTRRGWGVKIGQNLMYFVVEWPPIRNQFFFVFFDQNFHPWATTFLLVCFISICFYFWTLFPSNMMTSFMDDP